VVLKLYFPAYYSTLGLLAGLGGVGVGAVVRKETADRGSARLAVVAVRLGEGR